MIKKIAKVPWENYLIWYHFVTSRWLSISLPLTKHIFCLRSWWQHNSINFKTRWLRRNILLIDIYFGCRIKRLKAMSWKRKREKKLATIPFNMNQKLNSGNKLFLLQQLRRIYYNFNIIRYMLIKIED